MPRGKGFYINARKMGNFVPVIGNRRCTLFRGTPFVGEDDDVDDDVENNSDVLAELAAVGGMPGMEAGKAE